MSSIPSSPRGVACLVLTDSEKRVRFFETNTTNFHIDDDDDDGNHIIFYKDGNENNNNNNHVRNSHSQTEEQKVKCSYGPIRPKLSAKERELLYYSKADFAVFKEEAKLLAQSTDGSRDCRMYVQTFLDVYTGPSSSFLCHPEEMENHPINYNDDYHDDSDDDIGGPLVDRYNTTVLPLATAPVRGVERYTFPQLAQEQKRAIECVLQCHAHFPPSMDGDSKAQVLAAASSHLSRPARHLARVLGHADSIYALSIYKRTFLATTPAASAKTSKKSDSGGSGRHSSRSRSKKHSTQKNKNHT